VDLQLKASRANVATDRSLRLDSPIEHLGCPNVDLGQFQWCVLHRRTNVLEKSAISARAQSKEKSVLAVSKETNEVLHRTSGGVTNPSAAALLLS
jgi:hypothetical protein